MGTSLISIIGVDNAIVKKLKSKDVGSISNFVDLTRTPKAREALSEKTGISLQEISNWATQAELLRVPNMKAEEAAELIGAGIFSVEQLKKANKDDILDIVYRNNDAKNEKTVLTEKKLDELQRAKISSATPYEFTDLSDILYPGQDSVEEKNLLGVYSDLSSVISDLGKGIAEAQHELDLHSIEVQNAIFEDERLNSYGLNATWYVMPEVEFNLKMDYSVSRGQTQTAEYKIDDNGKKVLKNGISALRRIKVMPANATTQNMYKSEINQQSTLKLKFVPVPAEEKYTIRRVIPDCVGKMLLEAKRLLEDNGVAYKVVNALDAEVSNPDDSIVVSMTLELPGKSFRTANAGELLPIGAIVKLKV